MKFSLVKPNTSPLDLIAIGLWKGQKETALLRLLDRQWNHRVSTLLKREEFSGKIGEGKLIQGDKPIHALLIVGLGEPNRFAAESVRQLAAQAIRTGQKVHAKKVGIEEPSLPKNKGETLQGLAEGAILGGYSFDLYKSKENLGKKTVEEVLLMTLKNGKQHSDAVARGRVIAEATNRARDLINSPASEMTPQRMVQEAKKIGRSAGLTVRIFDRAACQKMGMGGFLAVARGSVEPPYLIHLTYRPHGKAKKRIALVGKGITFDSGGLSLKTAQGMETMKDDMSGAAAVLSLMKALPELHVPMEVHGIAAVTENMPSGSANKPGDVVRTFTGKTIEILNTDAEGRLTLADAIPYAIRQKPDLVIDLATLTGACVVALGELCSGIMGNDQGLIDRLIKSGEQAGERIWQLPLLDDYREEIKSPIADLKNIGGKGAGTITASLFLEEFVKPRTPWAHVDIAGPSWTEKELPLAPKGGTGCMVRTLAYFLTAEANRR